ncbi:hypothetical protein RIF29_38506 [Crotalaria pallida]|uniref:Uncharacterized protein n=1 Tax=Crotalaria pallida TaxID=3830 RepID=A0AAN9E0A4_CROPI
MEEMFWSMSDIRLSDMDVDPPPILRQSISMTILIPNRTTAYLYLYSCKEEMLAASQPFQYQLYSFLLASHSSQPVEFDCFLKSDNHWPVLIYYFWYALYNTMLCPSDMAEGAVADIEAWCCCQWYKNQTDGSSIGRILLVLDVEVVFSQVTIGVTNYVLADAQVACALCCLNGGVLSSICIVIATILLDYGTDLALVDMKHDF